MAGLAAVGLVGAVFAGGSSGGGAPSPMGRVDDGDFVPPTTIALPAGAPVVPCGDAVARASGPEGYAHLLCFLDPDGSLRSVGWVPLGR